MLNAECEFTLLSGQKGTMAGCLARGHAAQLSFWRRSVTAMKGRPGGSENGSGYLRCP